MRAALFSLLLGCSRTDAPIVPDPENRPPRPEPTVESVPDPTLDPDPDGDHGFQYIPIDPKESVDLDKAALLDGLKKVSRTMKCGPHGVGKVTITLDPTTGSVTHVTTAGAFPPAAASCLVKSFSTITVPPFDPPPKNYGWSIGARP